MYRWELPATSCWLLTNCKSNPHTDYTESARIPPIKRQNPSESVKSVPIRVIRGKALPLLLPLASS